VATGAGFPDALAASSLSAAEGWPLVLTPADHLTASTRRAMEEMGVSRAVVLGGSSVVRASVEGALSEWLGDEAVERLAARGVLVRSCTTFPGLGDHYIRVSIGDDRENALFMEAIRDL